MPNMQQKDNVEKANIVEDIFQNKMGRFGRWHLCVFLQVYFVVIVPFVVYPVFSLTVTVPHRCKIPALDDNSSNNFTFDEIANLTIPTKGLREAPVIGQTWQPCQQYNATWLDSLPQPVNYTLSELYDKSINSRRNKTSTMKCPHGYQYDTKERWQQYTAIERFDLVCDRSFLIPLSTTIYMIGQLVACTLGGYLSDKYGRRIMVVIGIAGTFVCGIVTAFSPTIWMLIVLRSLIGYFIMSMWMSYWVLLTEITDAKIRNLFMAICSLGFGCLATAYFTALAYLVQDWGYIHIGLTVLALPSACAIFLFPESPRWLLANGKIDEAVKLINKVIKINKKSSELLSEKEISELKCRPFSLSSSTVKINFATSVKSELKGLFILVSRPILAKRTLSLFLVWFTCSFTYYTMTFYSVKLDGNPYFTFWVMSNSAFVSTFLQYYLYEKLSRKFPVLLCLGLIVPISLAVLLYQQFRFDASSDIFVMICSTVVKLFIDVGFSMIYIYTSELYPTEIRNYGLGFNSGIARVGSMLAPFAIQLGDDVWKPMPFLLFVILCSISFLLVYFLPETKNIPLYDTIEELVKADKQQRRRKSSVRSQRYSLDYNLVSKEIPVTAED